MKKTRWFSPYERKGKTNLRPATNRAGVYLIKEHSSSNRAGVIVYVGMSTSNLYKTITRHFQKWDDPQQVRVTYSQDSNLYSIRVIFTTEKQAPRLEEALREHYKPRDNPQPLPEGWKPESVHFDLYEIYQDSAVITGDDYLPF